MRKTGSIIIISIVFCLHACSELEGRSRDSTICIADSIQTAWNKIYTYWDLKQRQEVSEDSDPQRAYATYFYNYYLEHPDLQDSDDALVAAFSMWYNTDDIESIQNSIRNIDKDSEVWAKLLLTIHNVYVVKKRYEEFIVLARELEEKLKGQRSKSELFHLLAIYYGKEDKERAKQYHSRIVSINADSFYVERAIGYIYELDSLNVGQKAPEFSAVDIKGNKISLSQFAGRYVLLDFWATWCGPCIQEIPGLIDVYSKYPHRKALRRNITFMLFQPCISSALTV